jgi:2-hydroxy-6-oxonona-2,4-dienedioate hydrolase
MSQYKIKSEDSFHYLETGGPGRPIVLLHGLMGALSNFEGILEEFGPKHNVLVPMLPIFDIPAREITVTKIVEVVESFVKYKNLDSAFYLGNSLGGHIAQLFALRNPDLVRGLILTGSSGLFESAMGNSFPKRGDKEFIRKKTESVFYDPAVATDELVDEVYKTTNDLRNAMSVVAVAKSAVRHNLEDKLDGIKCPTLLVWGIQDNVTPIWVGEKFHELIVHSELVKIDHCGHAPMMERSNLFNIALGDFIARVDNMTFFDAIKDVTVMD